jgi:hypothetical protein
MASLVAAANIASSTKPFHHAQLPAVITSIVLDHSEKDMDIPVLIEAIGDGRFRARSGEPMAVTVEAATRDEALNKRGHPVVLQNAVAHLSAGLAITVITIEEQLSGWYTLLRQAKCLCTAGRERPQPCRLVDPRFP